MKPILEIREVSKKFRIQNEKKPYLSLRESMAEIFRSQKGKTQDFWALRDVSFDVQRGETIGIIGRNGAGKSTLLKVLSRITPPTSGSILSRGRIASLLEVGTGFHPELSGRENVMMNGSILGMRRAEILRNFDAIVDFSGIEKFIDTPLKHYSSGMQLRLAFAVAAFLQNEILIIDEVLAVGDAEFQKKCIGKMEEVSTSGRTILFVSHQFSAIKKLCRTGVFLKNGEVTSTGPVDKVISDYTRFIEEQLHDHEDVSHADFSLRLSDDRKIFLANEDVRFHFTARRPDTQHDLKLGISIKDRYEKRVLIDFFEFNKKNDTLHVDFCVPGNFLTPGKYYVDISLQSSYEQFWIRTNAIFFDIDISTTIYESLNYDYGVVCAPLSWEEK